MKEFLKWLGVDENVAKVAVWVLIFMVSLIIFNTFLESTGLPFFKVTYQNLENIDTNIVIDSIFSWIITILNFYSIMLLIFRIKEAKGLFKYSIIYLILNIFINALFGEFIDQIFIILFMFIFAYVYSGKKLKYFLYCFISLFINGIVQFISYFFKTKFISFENINETISAIISFDYFIIIALVIITKEIYEKRRLRLK